MFDTERFIAEIQKRPCIWDVNNEEYGNKLRRQGAWVEIAEILYSDWFSSEENFKRKKGKCFLIPPVNRYVPNYVFILFEN